MKPLIIFFDGPRVFCNFWIRTLCIENYLIDKAKEKVDLEKVRFEGVISKLQKERVKNSEELTELKRLQIDTKIKKDALCTSKSKRYNSKCVKMVV